jgi:P2-related tail formation protein
VDTWDPSWTDAQKRQTIKNSVFVHRHKGTIGAVRSALASLGFSAQVQEWFSQLPAGDPYTFMLLLEADQVGIDQAALARIQEIVSVTKNLRSHLAEIVPSITSATGPMVAAVASIGSEIVISAFSYSLVADGIATANGQYDANGIKA